MTGFLIACLKILPPQGRNTIMSKKQGLNEDIALIETLAQDHHNLIQSRLHSIERLGDSREALKQALDTLKELSESCTLIKALINQMKDSDNGQSTRVRAG
jgi:hypothetical protein